MRKTIINRFLLGVLAVSVLWNQIIPIYAFDDTPLNSDFNGAIQYNTQNQTFTGLLNLNTLSQNYSLEEAYESDIEKIVPLTAIATIYDENHHEIARSEEINLKTDNQNQEVKFPILLFDLIDLGKVSKVSGTINITYEVQKVVSSDVDSELMWTPIEIETSKIEFSNDDIGYTSSDSNNKILLGMHKNDSSLKLLGSNLYEAYSVSTSEGMGYYIKGNPSQIVYCFNNERTQPPLLSSGDLPKYEKLDYLLSSDSSTLSSGIKQQIAAALYVGYPNDALGLQAKYGLNDDEARYYTQDALWCLIRGDQWFGSSVYNYWSALMDYALSNGAYDEGTVNFNGEFKLFNEGSLWKTDTISIEGTYKGNIEFKHFPDGMKIVDADTNNEIDRDLKVGDRFYLVYTGNDINQASFTIQSKHKMTQIDFYKLAHSPNGANYQNLIGLNSQDVYQDITVTIEENETKGKLEITKTDLEDGTLLPNAGFRIYNESKVVIAEGYTNGQGIATFELGY
ncbi:thioester-forming surface-anchored protein, partial [Turicibacter sanguinis]|nr:thioester-forming surface-anchored protein [Turicibacter sanguinis]